ncbi:MAG: Ca-activated chloride channel family protein [Cellvibrionaceae bacterium]|jgi:Ca-activated chloride channel family protein
MLSFQWPWIFLFIPLPLIVFWLFKPIKKQQAAVIVPFYREFIKLERKSIDFKVISRSNYKLLLLMLIWLCWITAAARPYWSGEALALPTSGRDLLVAVDISDSMQQADMEVGGDPATRLQSVKLVVNQFIQRRQGDRIGLVLFGTNAYLQAPLTFDTKTVAKFLQEAQLGFAGPKTAIGDAIGLSVKRLEELKNNNMNKVVILLTDGANTAGEIDPLQAAKLAQQTNIKIYTVGIGADQMTIGGFFGPRTINPSAQLDEKTLIEIADSTGGRYFRARETDELEKIYRILDGLEPVDQDQEWLRPIKSLFMWPLTLALLISVGFVFLSIKPSSLLPKKRSRKLSPKASLKSTEQK